MRPEANQFNPATDPNKEEELINLLLSAFDTTGVKAVVVFEKQNYGWVMSNGISEEELFNFVLHVFTARPDLHKKINEKFHALKEKAIEGNSGDPDFH